MLEFSPNVSFKLEGGRLSGQGGYLVVDGQDEITVAEAEFSGLIFTNPGPGGARSFAHLAVTHESSRPVVELTLRADSAEELESLTLAAGLVWHEANGLGRVTVGGLRGAEISDEGGGLYSFSAMASTVVVKVEEEARH